MSYVVKEVFRSVQGEGHHVGAPVVFVRFAGCNIWDGVEDHRARCAGKGRCAMWCDTDFRPEGATRYATPESLADAAHDAAGGHPVPVVLTGGEPGLQVDAALVKAIRRLGHAVHAESNGTVELPALDWLCVSPKPPAVVTTRARIDEVKVVVPAFDPTPFARLAPKRFVQPQDDADPVKREANVRAAFDWVMAHHGWRLSLQTHKILGVP